MHLSHSLRTSLALAAVAVVTSCLAWTLSAQPDAPPRAVDWAALAREAPAAVKVQLRETDETVHLVEGPDGAIVFVLLKHDGSAEPLSPEAFARRVHGEQSRRGFWLHLLNITAPAGVAWVALGLLGQVLFTGRMLYQWVASERSRRSVVPTAFWWMSVAGASMLLVYFVWRKDLVGVLGQATGWVIYLRNLWLIYRPSQPESSDARA